MMNEHYQRDALRVYAAQMPLTQARELVDTYYQYQDYRKALDSQLRAAKQERDGPVPLVTAWLAEDMRGYEKELKLLLAIWADQSPVGRWAQSIVGIGPVLSAGLLAHIDIRKAKCVSSLWRFAGLDPTLPRPQRGMKRGYNARLKVLCWKISNSFVKFKGHEQCLYGHLYEDRKQREIELNEAGAFADQAARALEDKNWRKATKARAAYEKGRLPDGHIDARARRYAVKRFLSHYFHVAYECEHGGPPPGPYVQVHGEHVHIESPPNWPMEG